MRLAEEERELKSSAEMTRCSAELHAQAKQQKASEFALESLQQQHKAREAECADIQQQLLAREVEALRAHQHEALTVELQETLQHQQARTAELSESLQQQSRLTAASAQDLSSEQDVVRELQQESKGFHSKYEDVLHASKAHLIGREAAIDDLNVSRHQIQQLKEQLAIVRHEQCLKDHEMEAVKMALATSEESLQRVVASEATKNPVRQCAFSLVHFLGGTQS